MNSNIWKINLCAILSIFFVFQNALAAPDWSAEARLPGERLCKDYHGHEVCFRDGNRENIYELDPNDFQRATERGATHALSYPVKASPLWIPMNSLERFFEEDTNSPIRKLIYKAAKAIAQFKDIDDVFKWLGLHKFPENSSEAGPNQIPTQNVDVNYRMGVTFSHHNGAKGATVSCAACHSSDLFGVKILGMTNRFPRANEFFRLGRMALANTPSLAFQAVFNPSKEDLYIFKRSKEAIKNVEIKKPLALGLDTSLAQVGLSLSRRGKDAYATPSPWFSKFPRKNRLRQDPADSKPAVWWNLKYKTKWLSDGSIRSGNPIYTNFLWNEIGRGVDLKKLEDWLSNNLDKVQELTAFVFSAKAPRYEEFFPGEINIEKAKRGQRLFKKNCSGCHGIYEKAWDEPGITGHKERLATTKIWYHETTPNIEVGTDPYRRYGMKHFYKDLNSLAISKTIGTVVEPQKGYTPPPLVGIWARWPYLHNNSVPTLYDMLVPAQKRPLTYIATPAQSKELDFDKIKNGYPAPALIKEPYRSDKSYHFDATKKGLRNGGHTTMLIDENGREKFSDKERYEIIEFLKTL